MGRGVSAIDGVSGDGTLLGAAVMEAETRWPRFNSVDFGVRDVMYIGHRWYTA